MIARQFVGRTKGTLLKPEGQMTFRLLVGLITLAIALSAVAQSDSDGELLHHRDKLFGIHAREQQVFVVGYPGRFLRSSDAGKTWKISDIGTREALMGIDFGDGNRGVIVGRNGLVLLSEDAGQTWQKIKTEVAEPLFAVDMIDGQYAFAVGHFNTILHSRDGGKSWVKQQFPLPDDAPDEPGLHAVHFVDPQQGWIVGEFGTIIHTTDGGSTWSSQASGVGTSLYDVQFFDAQNGIVVGAEGVLLTTGDGGQSWVRGDTGTRQHLFAVHGTASGALRAVGQEGVFISREKTGEPVAKRPLAIYTWLDNVHFFNAREGVVVGGRGHLMRTADGGRTWQQLCAQ